MKAVFICILSAATIASAVQVESTSASCVSHNVASVSFTLGDVSGQLAPTVGNLYDTSYDVNEAWNNDAALALMNQDLGLTLTANDLMSLNASGNGGSDATLTLNFTNSAYADYTAPITLYFTVGQMVNEGPLISLTLTGISNATYQYATYDGSGFVDNATFSSGKGMSTLIKVTGTLENSNIVTISTNSKKDGFGLVALKGIETGGIPEPTTATLSLLALAGLAARRRRK